MEGTGTRQNKDEADLPCEKQQIPNFMSSSGVESHSSKQSHNSNLPLPMPVDDSAVVNPQADKDQKKQSVMKLIENDINNQIVQKSQQSINEIDKLLVTKKKKKPAINLNSLPYNANQGPQTAQVSQVQDPLSSSQQPLAHYKPV